MVLLGGTNKEGAMIEFKVGDIFAEDAEALVNTVNCVGIMGRGVALQFKQAFPENFKAYAERCKRNEMRPGEVFVFETENLGNPRYIINFPTKRHWRGKSRTEDIESGLKSLVGAIEERGIRSIALPPLGSGLGGLDWTREVRPMLAASLSALPDVRFVVFEPGGGPQDLRANRSTDVPNMTPSRAALVVLMDGYIRVLLDPYITLLEVHKLMYFMQVAGEPLKLRFVKGHYGPYAENLRHQLHAVEGHFISGYLDGGDKPSKPLDLVPGAVEDAGAVLDSADDVRQRIERVRRVVEGFETAYGMELLATVHWVMERERPRDFDQLAQLVSAWGPRKRRFTERQLRIAADRLCEFGWADAMG